MKWRALKNFVHPVTSEIIRQGEVGEDPKRAMATVANLICDAEADLGPLAKRVVPDRSKFSLEATSAVCLLCGRVQEGIRVDYVGKPTVLEGLDGDLVVCQTCLSRMFKLLSSDR